MINGMSSSQIAPPNGQRLALSLVFIGQQNFYTDFLVDWLARFTDVRGVIWTASDRRTWSFRLRRVRQRIRRGGVFRAVSEFLYFAGAKFRYRRDEPALRQLIADARRDWNVAPVAVPAIHVNTLRDPQVQPFLEKLRPDILFTQCINEIIPRSVYSFPPRGCYVFHEGVVPQYRGKFCTHWAILNGDFDQTGASVIKVDAGLDRGAVAFVERVCPQTVGRGHGWLEHEVLFLALPRLRAWLEELAEGRATLTEQTEQYPLYSYPLFSHLWRIEKQKEEFDRFRQSRAQSLANRRSEIVSR
jgi:hypothetical protein